MSFTHFSETTRVDKVADSFLAISKTIYLHPFNVEGTQHWHASSITFRIDYTGSPIPPLFTWKFTTRFAVYRVAKGTGGTGVCANLVANSTTLITRGSEIGSPTSGTIYVPDTISSGEPPAILFDGLYVFAMKFEDESIVPSVSTNTIYSAPLASFSAPFYKTGGINITGAMPSTITFGADESNIPWFSAN